MTPGSLSLLPPSATEIARQTDLIAAALLVFSLLFSAIIFGMMLLFVVRYRKGSGASREGSSDKQFFVELGWTGASVLLGLVVFLWAGVAFVSEKSAPAGATTIYVQARQWMWEVEHPDGRRELNELHVPIGRPVRLVLSSEDVIHSFYVPAFRVKQDAVPGMYTSLWFTPDRVGRYHLFCAEYCGADHARMTGWVHVLGDGDYRQWLGRTPPTPSGMPTREQGLASFQALGCDQCHHPDTDKIAPYLEGLFGSSVELADGSSVIADEQYIRESILDPAAKVVKGYDPHMPSYAGQLDEARLRQVITAVRALGREEPRSEEGEEKGS